MSGLTFIPVLAITATELYPFLFVVQTEIDIEFSISFDHSEETEIQVQSRNHFCHVDVIYRPYRSLAQQF